MRFSRAMINTVKEAPQDAEAISHQLLIRAGMIRKVSQGIYTFLPLGVRVLMKIEKIIREELARAGAQEVLLPFVLPSELWIESGRWDIYGKELLRFQDRNSRWFCLGPTHEEAITELVRREVRSYKQLPINLFQIQVKFRDEIRPRFGLMRAKEFIMKDGYSFHEDEASLEETYKRMFEAYAQIFSRCGFNFRAVEAETGTIGGSFSHEFMVLADTGEEIIMSCNECQYAASLEKAEVGFEKSQGEKKTNTKHIEKVSTPGKKSVDEVSRFLKVTPDKLIKTIVFSSEKGPFAVLVAGNREVNITKVKKVTGLDNIEFADGKTIEEVSGAPVGYAGPVGLKIKKFADLELRDKSGMVTGANERDYHLINVDVQRDIETDIFGDIRNAADGDPCPRCRKGYLKSSRGIEVGHIFKLGKKYSSAMKATFQDRDGKEREFVMGCYGIGVSRVLAAAVEQWHDERGIIWPKSIAPYSVEVMPVNWKDDIQRLMAEKIYVDISHEGIDVLLDDRDVSPGVKFMDSDLIGFPIRIVVGQRYTKEKLIEIKERGKKEALFVKAQELINHLKKLL